LYGVTCVVLPLSCGFTPEAVVPDVPEVLYIGCVARVHVLYNVQQQYIASADPRGPVIEVEGQGLLRLALSRSPEQVAYITATQHENLQTRNKQDLTPVIQMYRSYVNAPEP
jgi:hypothetical protein